MIQISSAVLGEVAFAMACDEQGRLIASIFSEETENKAVKGVMKSIPQHLHSSCQTSSPDQKKFKELNELYMGKGAIGEGSFDLPYVSPFGRKVYLLLHAIPHGRVTTYGAIAEKLGSRHFSRAVGSAVGSNPLSLVIPCHRVVTSTLEVLNYGMPDHKPSEGAPVKRGLLEREGVLFTGRKVSSESFWSPP